MILAVCAMILIRAAPVGMDQSGISSIVNPDRLQQIGKELGFTEGPCGKTARFFSATFRPTLFTDGSPTVGS
jgi:hypothetical protein